MKNISKNVSKNISKKRNPVFNFYLLSALMLVLSTLIAACGDTATAVPPTTAAATTVAATSAAAATTAAVTTAAATTAASAAATTAGTTSAAATVAAATTAAASGTGQLGLKPLVIGLITSRTSALSYYGEMLERGFMLGLDYYTKGTNKIGGREVKVLVEDDNGTPEKAVDAARKLVQQDGAEILVGTPGSPQALAISAVNDKELKKIFIVTPAAAPALTGTNFSRYVFRTARNTDQDAVVGAAYAVSLATKSKKIVSFYQDNAFGQGANAGWKEIGTKTAGISWVEVAVPPAATEFTPYIQKVLDAAPDVMVLNWAGTTGAKLFQQMKDNDLFNKIVAVSPVGDANTIKAAGDVLIGTQGVGLYWNQFPKTAENDALVKAYKDKYNTFPDIFAPDGFAAASAIQTALDKTSGDTDPEKLIPAMEGMSFLAPKGKETFRKEDHQALQPMYIVKMVKDTTGTYDFPIPQLVKEYSADEAAPPIRRK
jgi:branched-chain amino acid transport system substrate-binding protein